MLLYDLKDIPTISIAALPPRPRDTVFLVGYPKIELPSLKLDKTYLTTIVATVIANDSEGRIMMTPGTFPGGSGSAVVNPKGELVGICIGSSETAALAIPLDVIKVTIGEAEKTEPAMVTIRQTRLESELELDVWRIIDYERVTVDLTGRQGVAFWMQLWCVAHRHSENMANSGCLNHSGCPDTSSLEERLATCGYLGAKAVEEIVEIEDSGNPEILVKKLMSQEKYRKIILNPEFHDMAVGHAYNQEVRVHYWTLVFAGR